MSKTAATRVWPTHAKTGDQRRNFRKKANKFELNDGTLHFNRKKSKTLLRVIKTTEKEEIMQACHSKPTAGHLGIVKTRKKIMQRYYWPGCQSKEIGDFIGMYTHN